MGLAKKSIPDEIENAAKYTEAHIKEAYEYVVAQIKSRYDRVFNHKKYSADEMLSGHGDEADAVKEIHSIQVKYANDLGSKLAAKPITETGRGEDWVDPSKQKPAEPAVTLDPGPDHSEFDPKPAVAPEANSAPANTPVEPVEEVTVPEQPETTEEAKTDTESK